MSQTQQAQHTPGPWDFFVGNANGRGLIRVETALGNPNGGGEHICSMPRGEVSEANAAFIAAAPETAAKLAEVTKERDGLKVENKQLFESLRDATLSACTANDSRDELLQALTELVRCVRGGDETDSISMDDALQDADIAIADASNQKETATGNGVPCGA